VSLEDTLTNMGLSRIAHEIGMTKIAIDSLTRELHFQRTMADLQKPDDFMKKAEESDALIRENFREWRDYLYKYILVMTTITGFFATLISANWTRVVPDLDMVFIAFILIGCSIAVGLIAIFATIYIEKKIIDARVIFALGGKNRGERVNPVDAIRIDCDEYIAENAAKLETETDPKEIEWLNIRIKADKRVSRLMKYVAAPAGWYEYVRTGTTALMVVFSFAGIVVLMREFLVHSFEPSVSETTISSPME